MVQSNATPDTWDGFKNAIIKEFIPEDHSRRAREWIKRCKQTGSVYKYISAFRNVTLAVHNVREGEKFDRFVDGLKPNIRIEVMKSNVRTIEDASKIAMRIDSAIWHNYNDQSYQRSSPAKQEATPMEIGNFEKASRKPLNADEKKQREIDRKNKACFVCQKSGCRPWKQRSKVQTNNTEMVPDDEDEKSKPQVSFSDSDSEN